MKHAAPLLCALLLAIAGCSSVKLTYNQLDWLIPWYISDYVDFTDDQNAFLEQRLHAQLRWHRDTQLPDYAVWLRQLRRDLEDGLAREEIVRYGDRIRSYWQALLLQISPDASALLASATDEQVDELFANLEKKNQEFMDDYVKVAAVELRQKRAEKVREHLERWLDKLNREQETAVAEWSERFEPASAETLSYRRQWQAQLRRLLAGRRDKNGFDAALRDHLLHPEKSQSVFLQQKRMRNREMLIDLLLEIDKLMSAGQRKYLITRLTELANDFESLAGTAD